VLTVVRSARLEDGASAAEVIRASISQLCRDDHRDDAAILNAWLSNKTPATVTEWIGKNPSGFLVAERGGLLVGVGAISSQGDILLNYVHPDARFQGVSTALLDALEQRGHLAGCREIRLVSTQTALRFYSARGYRANGAAIAGIGGKPSFPMSRAFKDA
jgi:GNAT superfamily N-acetyltransferase